MTSDSTTSATGNRFGQGLQGYEHWGLILGVVIQLGVLGGMIGMRLVILWTGQTYYVRVQPVDPRDLMRGDYVILGYEFSRLPHDHRVDWFVKDGLGKMREGLAGATVYVTLTPEGDGKHWRAERFSLQPPQDRPYLRGTLDAWGRLTYGIESYFVQEGKGHAYEDAVRSGRLTAEIVVKPDGEAAIRKLHIDAR